MKAIMESGWLYVLGGSGGWRKGCAYQLLVASLLGLLSSTASASWRSTLYPAGWLPPSSATSFYTARFLQDFSYAGYKRGEESVPEITGPVFNVLDYGADAGGTSDSTAAIQATIDAAASAGGGVVFMPAGTYRVAPQGSNNYALRISSAGIVLRGAGVGQTFILNTSYVMRSKSVILVAPASVSSGASVAFTADLEGPTRRIPVANAGAFSVGDIVRMEWVFTQAWIDEHNQGSWWNDSTKQPAPAQYLREVMAVNTDEGWIEVDVPTRYTMKVRDSARVFRRTGMLSEVGIEDFSIGNVQHPGPGFGEADYTIPGTAGWDAHASYLVSLNDMHDSWISNVSSFQPAGNTSTCHMLSNGIVLTRCFRVTVRNSTMRRGQYGGGGGNAYMFRVGNGNENLLVDCLADFSRHGLVLSHAGTSGNVFLRCEDRNTQRATGLSGSYTTSGSGSDHHMHFSHSNLFDGCHAHNSFYTAHHRGSSGTTPHALTSAHGVYWNTSGSGTRYSNIVVSEQARYGYVIGTSGEQSGVSTTTGGNTSPADHREGVGMGATLEPQSLYADQFAKRMQGVFVFIKDATITPTAGYPLRGTVYHYVGGSFSSLWTQVGGTPVSIADPDAIDTTVDIIDEGVYAFELRAWAGGFTNSAVMTITVSNGAPVVVPAFARHFIRGARESGADPLGYFTQSSNLVGTQGSSGARDSLNPVFGFSLPVLPPGRTLDGVTFQFEITQARDSTGGGNLPQLHAYLLQTDDPTDTGTAFFYHGSLDPAPNVKRIGTTSVSINTTADVNYAPGEQARSFALSGEALEYLQGLYNGITPVQSNVYFRFNLSVNPSITTYRRYRVSTLDDASALVLSTQPVSAIRVQKENGSIVTPGSVQAWPVAVVNEPMTAAYVVTNQISAGVNLALTGSPVVVFAESGTASYGGFTIATNITGTATNLAPGETASFSVSFVTETVGIHTATVSIASTDETYNPYEFQISISAAASEDTFSIQYQGNGNTGGSVPDAQTKLDGIGLVLASNSGELTRDGYSFAGWNTAPDGSGLDYAEGASYVLDADLTLFAKWALNPPDAPWDLAAQAYADRVVLNWSVSANTDETMLMRFDSSQDSYAEIAVVSSNTYVDSAVVNGQEYYYVVVARNAAGQSEPSSETSVTVLIVLPFVEDFENRAPGDLDGQNHWASAGAVVQSERTNTGLQAAEITTTDGYLQQQFAGTRTSVWTDLFLQPAFIEGDIDMPDSGAACVLVFNAEGHPVVFNGQSPQVLEGVTVATGAWIRVTILADHAQGLWDLYINEELIAGNLGYYSTNAVHYTGLKIKGAGETSVPVDDIQIVLQRPWGDVVVTENFAVPHDWLRSFYPALTTPEEFEAAALAVDANGVPNWQKYWTGMNPLNPDSVLRIRQVVLQNGQFALRWEHDAASPDLPPIAIQMRTNLLTGAWEPIGQFVPVNGENSWTNSTLLPNAFYRFAVTNAPAGP
jgi:hypothetical protein